MTIRDELSVIGAGLRRLATTEQPWPKVTLDVVRAITRRIVAGAGAEPADRAVVVGSLLHTSALDLAAVVGADQPATDVGRERLSEHTTGSNRGALPADR